MCQSTCQEDQEDGCGDTSVGPIHFLVAKRGRSGHPVLDAGDFDLRGGLFKALGQMTYHISGTRGTHDRLHSSTLCAGKSLEQLGMALIEHGSRSDGSMWEREYGNPKTAGPIRPICILNFHASDQEQARAVALLHMLTGDPSYRTTASTTDSPFALTIIPGNAKTRFLVRPEIPQRSPSLSLSLSLPSMASMQYGAVPFGYQTSNMSGSSRSGNYQPRSFGQFQHQHPHQHQQPADTFTAEMRDRQARGKDPYQDSKDSSDPSNWAARRRSKKEPFAVEEKRHQAAQILDNPELLMMNAQRENDSLPATRLRYTRMLCGVEEPAQPSNQQRGSTSKAPVPHQHSSKSRTHTPTKRHGSSGGERPTR
ncbi:hypothetical protein SCAR479_04311 [Seiridium cardinale]|uniref:Uncharacterized protein n=1 Tax=Seiridium cardinale TaxID=138064 RepID=A0ABR2XXZ1_9PEZI